MTCGRVYLVASGLVASGVGGCWMLSLLETPSRIDAMALSAAGLALIVCAGLARRGWRRAEPRAARRSLAIGLGAGLGGGLAAIFPLGWSEALVLGLLLSGGAMLAGLAVTAYAVTAARRTVHRPLVWSTRSFKQSR